MTTPPPLSLPAAEALAHRLRVAIMEDRSVASSEAMAGYFFDRVAADVAGLRECWTDDGAKMTLPSRHADRFSDNLRRTAALYGVTP